MTSLLQGARGIPIIIHPCLQRLLNYLVDPRIRAKAGIPEDNPFVLARKDTTVSIYDAVNKLASASDLTFPERIGCTAYRMYLATYIQVNNYMWYQYNTYTCLSECYIYMCIQICI